MLLRSLLSKESLYGIINSAVAESKLAYATLQPLCGSKCETDRSEEIMKKRIGSVAAALLAAGLLSGCENAEKPLHQVDVDKYVTLGDYQNISVEVEPYEVSEEDLKDLLAEVYMGYVDGDFGTVDRAVQDGDTVIIDYVGKQDGVAFEGGTAEDAWLTIGSDSYIDGFEDGLVGVKPGETVDLNLTFPLTYQNNPDLAGAEVVFTVTVNKVIPGNEEDMDDAVAAAIELEDRKLSSIAELKQLLWELLEEEAQFNYESEQQDSLADALLTQSTFGELPEYLLEDYKAIMNRQLEEAAEYYEVTPDGYTIYFYGMTVDQFISTYLENTLKRDLALQAIANREGLGVDDEELEQRLQEEAAEGGYADVDELLDGRTRDELRTEYMSEKVYDFLLGK